MEDEYIKVVATRKFDSPLSEQQRKKNNICFIGPTSVGKSSLYNNLFNLKLEVGLGAVTHEATAVVQN